MQSLQSKLSSGLLLSLLVTFSAIWLLVSINIQFLAEDYIASRLKHDAETLLSSIRYNKSNQLEIDTTRVDQIYNQPFSGHYYIISTGKQTLTSRSLWDKKLKYKNVNTGEQSRTVLQGPEQQSLLLTSIGYEKQGISLTITVAEDLNPINNNIMKFKYWFAAVSLSMLLILVVIQIFILRKSLTPLNKAQHELKSLQHGKLEKLSTDSPEELRPLITEINHLLKIMQQRLSRSRDALGDLAHAIKKPLTVIKQITDADDISDSTKSILMKQTDSIHQITDHILKRAQVAGSSYGGSIFSFERDLPDLVKTLDMMYGNKKINLSSNIEKNIVSSFDRQDMLELLGNLLENAYKWADHKIILNVEIDTNLHICIDDDGPGTDPEKMFALPERGVRLDERKEGHGFGLAISTDIINDYNGRIHLTHSDILGGFKVEITLPLHQL